MAIAVRSIYAAVLQALGLLEGLSQVADMRNDSVGQALASNALPKHVPTSSEQPDRPTMGLLSGRDYLCYFLRRAPPR